MENRFGEATNTKSGCLQKAKCRRGESRVATGLRWRQPRPVDVSATEGAP